MSTGKVIMKCYQTITWPPAALSTERRLPKCFIATDRERILWTSRHPQALAICTKAMPSLLQTWATMGRKICWYRLGGQHRETRINSEYMKILEMATTGSP